MNFIIVYAIVAFGLFVSNTLDTFAFIVILLLLGMLAKKEKEIEKLKGKDV